MKAAGRLEAVTVLLLVTPLFSFHDPEITESSGLVAGEGTVLTVNDSGADPVVYVVDAASGETVGRTTYAGEVTDVEAVAAGPDGSVWVGDIGDNGGQRLSVALYRLDGVTPGDREVSSTRYELAYRGGPRDAEALLVHPRSGRSFVVSKGLFGGQVWAAPAELSPDGLNPLRPVGEAGALVTDGAFLPGGRHAVLRSYTRATFYDARTWEPVASMRLPRQDQGEGLAVTADGDRLLLSSEGAHSEVLSVPLSDEVLAAVSREPAPSPPALNRSTAPADEVEEGSAVGWPLAAGGGIVVAAVVVLALRAARRRSRSTR